MRGHAAAACTQAHGAGGHGVALGPKHHQRQADAGDRHSPWVDGVGVRRQDRQQREEVARQLGRDQSEEVLQLRQPDQHRNAVGEADDDGHRHVAHQCPELEQPHQEQQHAGHRGADQQVGQAVAFDDAVDDDNEGTGRPGNLHPAAAQRRDQKAGNDGREQALFGFDTRGDGKGHGQRQRNDADREAGADVGHQVGPRIAGQGIEQPGSEAMKTGG